MNTDTPTAELPPISPRMQAFLDKSFLRFPGRVYAHLEAFEPEIDAQLVPRGLVIKQARRINGRMRNTYHGVPPPDQPPVLDPEPQPEQA